LTIAILSIISRNSISEDVQEHPRSLFQGTKGAKVVKLAISTALNTVANNEADSAETMNLCGVALETIDATLVDEWLQSRGSRQIVEKLVERAKRPLDEEMLQAVSDQSFPR
jgi:hypothetical protein